MSNAQDFPSDSRFSFFDSRPVWSIERVESRKTRSQNPVSEFFYRFLFNFFENRERPIKLKHPFCRYHLYQLYRQYANNVHTKILKPYRTYKATVTLWKKKQLKKYKKPIKNKVTLFSLRSSLKSKNE